MPTIDLSNVTVVIPTFLRPGYVHNCIASIKGRLPECPVVVACDDGGYTDLSVYAPFKDFKYVQLPFDSGLTVKRNRAVELVETEYTLIACDDFDFGPKHVREGIVNMRVVLDHHAFMDVAVGTYNDKSYEGTLHYVPGEYIAERRISKQYHFGEWSRWGAIKIDIGINYFLARTKILRQIPWDENIGPIGGEHADWFMTMKDYERVVVWVPNCPISAFERNNAWMHPDYRSYRWRAVLTGHKKFLEKWGVKQYIGFDEELPK